eukprot:PRCOL_00007275-RA
MPAAAPAKRRRVGGGGGAPAAGQLTLFGAYARAAAPAPPPRAPELDAGAGSSGLGIAGDAPRPEAADEIDGSSDSDEDPFDCLRARARAHGRAGSRPLSARQHGDDAWFVGFEAPDGGPAAHDCVGKPAPSVRAAPLPRGSSGQFSYGLGADAPDELRYSSWRIQSVRETPTAMAYDDTGVLLAVGTRDGRLAVYNHTTLVGHAAAALAARNELAAASSLAAAADADASRSLRAEGIAGAGVGGSAGGDREAMAAHKRLAYAPPAPLVELSSRGGEWSALRWNPRNENEVVLSARTSGRVCVYDLAYCKTTPTQMLVAPSASAAGNAGGAGGSGAASSARAFEDVACLAPGGAYDVAAATRDGTVLLWDRRAGPRPVTTLLGPGGRANRLGPLRALGCVRLDGATGGTIVYAGTRGGRVLTWDVRKSGGSQVSAMPQPRGKSLLSAATTVGGGPRRGGRVGSGLGGGVHALLSVWEASDNSAVCALPVPAASGAHVHAAELPYVLTNGEVGILGRDDSGGITKLAWEAGDAVGSAPRSRTPALCDGGRTLALTRSAAHVGALQPEAQASASATLSELAFLSLDLPPGERSLGIAAAPVTLPAQAAQVAAHPLTDEVCVGTDDGMLLMLRQECSRDNDDGEAV